MKNKDILFVDDDRFIQKIYGDRLNAEGFKVSVAETIEDAKEKMSDSGFDLVILDYVFAGTSGLELLRWMRKMKLETRVIILSALSQMKNMEEAKDAGATMYLAKDKTTPNDLVKKIEELLGK